jgi:class 3 adenylate cyclase
MTEKATLLIVDDSVENLQILSGLLKEEYKLIIAKSGEKALEIARNQEPPDLILLDVMMPGMNGFEVCDALKKDSSTQNIPVIFLTALNEVADETKGFQVGGSDFIIKPFNPDIVKARIRTHLDLMQERKKSESLLKILLPENVISDLITHGKHIPVMHENVSIMFCDFVGFTSISSRLSPEILIDELSVIFSEFDEICSKNGATRIKTIGDAYMATTGLNLFNPDHANQLVQTGMDIIQYLESRNTTAAQQWHCRIGIHSGSVIAGIVGKTRYVYDVLGDSVNIASRVESAGVNMKVTITDETRQLLHPQYKTQSLGLTILKGKGEMHLHAIE